MSMHLAHLAGSKRDRETINLRAMEPYFEGEADLGEGLGLNEDLLNDLRRQAHALMCAGHFQRSVDVTLSLVAMGSVHPADALMLAQCYRTLGMEQAADQCEQHGDKMMAAMGYELPAELNEENEQ